MIIIIITIIIMRIVYTKLLIPHMLYIVFCYLTDNLKITTDVRKGRDAFI
jgi:hypothetical protein